MSLNKKVCGKGFKHRRSLNRHVKLHSGEKNFKCMYCATAFARSDHLKAHIRTHNNTKPYRCAVCQCGYSTQAALKVHIAHHHSKSKFKCVLCNNLEFHSQLALEGHIYTKHSKENTADIDDLINETATINPTLINVEEASNYNLLNQRTRLIEINNYTNLNKSTHQTPGGGSGGSNSSGSSMCDDTKHLFTLKKIPIFFHFFSQET
jgi:adenosyl cobinamide kinase/adenosyl cobinamide phosphate guanylyltransferase